MRFIENFTCTNLNIIDGTNKVDYIDIQADPEKIVKLNLKFLF